MMMMNLDNINRIQEIGKEVIKITIMMREDNMILDGNRETLRETVTTQEVNSINLIEDNHRMMISIQGEASQHQEEAYLMIEETPQREEEKYQSLVEYSKIRKERARIQEETTQIPEEITVEQLICIQVLRLRIIVQLNKINQIEILPTMTAIQLIKDKLAQKLRCPEIDLIKDLLENTLIEKNPKEIDLITLA